MSRSLFAFEAEARKEGGYGFTAKELENASIEICNCLCGEYKDERGRRQKVQGDLSKVRKVKTFQIKRVYFLSVEENITLILIVHFIGPVPCVHLIAI